MIIDLQRRLAEIGRIRIGQQVPAGRGTRPEKLNTFRLTSADRNRITAAARLYGGTPAQWDAPAGPQWEVITETNVLGVIVPPSDMAFSQNYELWSAGGCTRRCDGINESINQGPCQCDPDKRECSIHTRLSVMIRDLPGLGVWRIDTSGYYAAVELQGAVEVVRMAAGRGQMLPAALRLEQRAIKRVGKTVMRFAVPVLDVEVSPAQLLGGQAALDPGTIAIEPPRSRPVDGGGPLTPVPELPEAPVVPIAEQVAAVRERPKRKNAAAAVPRTGLAPRTAAQAARAAEVVDAEPVDEPPPEEEPEPAREMSFTPDQRRKGLNMMHALFTEADIPKDDRDDRLAVTAAIIGHPVESSNDLTDPELFQLVNTLREWKNTGQLGAEVTEILNLAALAEEQLTLDAEESDG